MNTESFYQQVLEIYSPWRVTGVSTDSTAKRVIVSVEHDPMLPVRCPSCDLLCRLHDHGPKRQWRQLDTMDYQTYLEGCIPRVNCPTHGVLNANVPWAERGSKYSFKFESYVLFFLTQTSIKAVAETFCLSWDVVDGIMGRGVDRGLARRKLKPVRALGIDEIAYQKRHQYASILLDKDTDAVLDVLIDRKKETLLDHLQSKKDLYSRLEIITMDMWEPFLAAFRAFDSEADKKICFDRFHVASHFSKAVDQVRANEHRELMSDGDERLMYTRFEWLRNALKTDNRARRYFMTLTRLALKTARAWAMKETASGLWDFVYRGAAESAWKRLLRWLALSRLEPMIRVGKMIRTFLWGILNAIMARASNAASESKNASIQKIKARACGFRNRERFKRAILFHLGKIDVFPKGFSFPILSH